MKVNVVKEENNTVQLDIEIDAEHAAQEYNKACKKLGERVTVPGFRKGKAPRAMVENYVGDYYLMYLLIPSANINMT